MIALAAVLAFASPSQVIRAVPTRPLRIALKVPAPAGVSGAHGASECAAHTGLLGALVCPDMVKSGNLLLVWSWDGQGRAIDGFHVYRVDGPARRLVDTVRTKGDLTLSDVPKPGAGYGGACYAVGAFRGAQESELAAPFCADGRSAAITIKMVPTHIRGSHRVRNMEVLSDWRAVGFIYSKTKNVFGDDRSNAISRLGVAFDVSGQRDRTLVSAKLHLAIDLATDRGDNHSCATDVGDGSSFWWLDSGWIDGRFGSGIVPTDTGPVITADVTTLVAPWFRGEPNYGFVLKNDNENIDAFTDQKCLTAYSPDSHDYVLELTYY